MRSMRQLFLQSWLPIKQSEGKVRGYDEGQRSYLVMTFLFSLLNTSGMFCIFNISVNKTRFGIQSSFTS